jgi:tetratricopeptide (TPR) repeat protein
MSVKQAEQPTAYLKVVSEESEIVNRQTLSPGFHARYPAFFVSRYPDAHHWPPDPDDPEAVQLMQQGQESLYQQNDTGMAIQCFKKALMRQPGYLKAWVALTVALIAENTEISLDDAERVLRNLLSYGDDIPQIARWMLHANFGTLWVHRSLMGKGTEQEQGYLQRADEQYTLAESLEEDEAHLATRAIRAYVKLGLGEIEDARRFWNMLQENPDARLIIEEYEAKYPELKQLPTGGTFL